MKQPLKEMLKAIGGEHLLNESKLSTIDKLWSSDIKLTSPEGRSMKKENAKLVKELNNELKKLGINEKAVTSYAHTAADVRINGDLITVSFTGPQGTKIQYDGGSRNIILKPSISIKDIAKKISKLG